MDILLGDPPDSIASYRYSYHAGESILGSVSIRSEIDIPFESLDIFFIGRSSEITQEIYKFTLIHLFTNIQARKPPHPEQTEITANSTKYNLQFMNLLYPQTKPSRNIDDILSHLLSKSPIDYPPHPANTPSTMSPLDKPISNRLPASATPTSPGSAVNYATTSLHQIAKSCTPFKPVSPDGV